MRKILKILFTIADEPIQIDNHSFTMSLNQDVLQPQSEEIIADPQPLEIEEKKKYLTTLLIINQIKSKR